MSKKKPLTDAEMEREDAAYRKRLHREESFSFGTLESIRENWSDESPNSEELRVIILNLMHKLAKSGIQ